MEKTREIYLDAPNVGRLEKEYLDNAIDAGYVSTVGPFVPRFEEKLAGYLGVKNAVSIQNGTTAICMALRELGIKKGDEVIVPALTFVATVNPVVHLGGTPVFVDVDPSTWNIDHREIEKAVTKKTKAIIPVHLYGNPCCMDEIMKLAAKHGIYVVEDATESLGAKYKGKYTGTIGDFGCFSFNGNKIITTGGGGALVGNKEDKLTHIKFLSNQAKDASGRYYYPEAGFNYRMTNIAAALGLAQMERLEGFLEKKRNFNAIYREELENIKTVCFQGEYPQVASSYWLSCVAFKGTGDVNTVQEGLKKMGIATRRTFTPIVEFPPYQKFKQGDCKNSYEIYERALCLPSSTLNSEDDVRYISKAIKDIMRTARGG